MCGISGLIGWPGSGHNGQLIIKKMIGSLHHRGPDDNGFKLGILGIYAL
mgnify:CR=1 FL=1